MDDVKALSVLSALANGVNPVTGEVFPPDSPYQSAELVRALFIACRALEGRSAPGRAKANGPSNAGKPWKEEEDRRLLSEFDRGSSMQELAQALGRTPAGILARLEKHGRAQAPAPHERGAPSVWRRSPSGRAES